MTPELKREDEFIGPVTGYVTSIKCGVCDTLLLQYKGEYLWWKDECEHFVTRGLCTPYDDDETLFKIVKTVQLKNFRWAIISKGAE